MTTPTSPSDRERIERYEPTAIEPAWQQRWADAGIHKTDLSATDKPKYYLLTMYPYPSGDLHIGHWYIKTPTDARARFLRMNGHNVFFPIGFDAFGLPAENAAIKQRIHPAQWTMKNIANMRRQLRSMGATFDWDSEVVTCTPEYYRWNQWIFLKYLEAGLAYRKMAAVDWCPKDQVVLAREQVEGVDRVCWRCGTPGHQARPGAVVLPHHEVRGRAAGLHGHRLAGAGAPDADQLDRPLGGRGGRLPDRAGRRITRVARS